MEYINYETNQVSSGSSLSPKSLEETINAYRKNGWQVVRVEFVEKDNVMTPEWVVYMRRKAN